MTTSIRSILHWMRCGVKVSVTVIAMALMGLCVALMLAGLAVLLALAAAGSWLRRRSTCPIPVEAASNVP